MGKNELQLLESNLYIDEIFEYIPDFLVKDFEYKGREILIEAHEKISEDDVEKYRKFRSIFGVSYYMIMIVTDEELRIWNEYDQGKQGFFNEIWPDDDAVLLIEDLRKKREDYEREISKYGQRAFCPAPPPPPPAWVHGPVENPPLNP